MEAESLIDVKIQSDSFKKSKEIERDLKRIDKSAEELQKELKETGEAAEKTGQRIAKSTGEVDKRFKKTAKEAKAANESFHGLKGGTEGLKTSLSGIAKIGIAATLTGMAVAAAGAISTFSEFNQSLGNLSAITGATGDDLQFYSDKAREMGAVTTQTASEVAQAFQLVASAKPDLLSSKEALAEVTGQAILLAEAAGISVPEAANTMASALNQFGADASEAARFTDVLAAGSVAGAASIAEMGEALKASGVVASGFGLSFEQTNAVLQLFSTNAIKGSEAGTKLRGALIGLETKTDSLEESLGVGLKPSVVGLEQALINLGEANLTTTEKTKIFGVENLVAGNILLENVSKIDEMTKAVSETGVAQEQANARTDTFNGAVSRLGSAFEELQLTLTSDTGVGSAVKSFIDGIATATLKFSDFLKVLGGNEEQTSKAKKTIDDLAEAYENVPIEQLKDSIIEVNNRVLESNKVLADNKGAWTFGAKAAEEYIDKQKNAEKTVKSGETALKAMNIALERQVKAENDLLLQEVKVLSVKKKLSEEIYEQHDAIRDVVEKLDEEYDALGRTALEQEIYVAITEAGVEANSKAGVEIANKVEKLHMERQAIEDKREAEKQAAKEAEQANKDAEKAAEDLAKAAKEAAEESEKAFLETRDGLADFFVDVVENGKGAFETLFDNFKNMLIRMLAEAAANKILLSFGFAGGSAAIPGMFSGLFGGGGGGGGNILSTVFGGGGVTGTPGINGGSGGTGIPSIPGVSNLFSGGSFTTGISNFATAGFNNLSGVYQGVGNIASDLGFNSVADAAFASGDQYLNASNWANLGNLGLNIGAGFVGNLAGSEIFGDSKHGGTLGTVGGAVGSIWGPIGTAIGSFLGQGLGKLIGGKNRADRTQLDVDFATGEVTRGRSRGHDLDEAAQGATDAFLMFAETIGGSNASFSVRAHGEHGFGFEGEGRKQFEDVEDFLNEGFDRIVKGSEKLGKVTKDLLISFEGTAEETMNFASAVVALDDQLKFNGVDKAISDFESLEEQMEIAALGPIDSYMKQVEALGTVIDAYDGSTLAAQTLASGLAATNDSVYKLAAGMLQLKENLSSVLQDSASEIRQSVMEPEEITSSLREQRNELRKSLHLINDPDELRTAVLELDRLTSEIFDSLSPERQEARAEDFAQYLERLDEAQGKQLDRILRDLARTQEDIQKRSEEAIKTASGEIVTASEVFNEAAETIAIAAQSINQAMANNGVATPNRGGEII